VQAYDGGGAGANLVPMTSLPDRPRTALLVIDVQNGVMAGAHDRDRVVAAIGDLVTRARTEDVPVIWVQHADDQLVRDSVDWCWVPELEPERREAEPLVHKGYGDAFEATELEPLLAERGVGHLVVSGAQTDACIRATLHGALVRGYDATLVADAHTTEDLTPYGAPPPDQVIAHTNLYWDGEEAPGRRGTTVPAADLTFAPPAGD
jgi:isochorismate hydrolase